MGARPPRSSNEAADHEGREESILKDSEGETDNQLDEDHTWIGDDNGEKQCGAGKSAGIA